MNPDVEPAAFTRDRIRAELTASLPADPKWVAWVDGVLDRLEDPSPTVAPQTEFWEVMGGIGGRRVACDLPSRAAAEEVADQFARRMARLDAPQTRTYVERQSHRYEKASS